MTMELGLKEIISKHDLQLSDVKSKCAETVRVRIAAQLIDWKLIAHYLGFAQVKIHAIHVYNENEERRRVAFLEEWAEKNGDGATYLKLAEAFYDRGRMDLIDQLCKMIKRAMKRPALRVGNSEDSTTLTSVLKVREERRFSLIWKHDNQAALRTMCRWSDAVVSGNTVYFLPGEMYTKKIIVYHTGDCRWSEFRSHSPHSNSSLAIIDNALTTVGGGGFPYTNKLYSFTEEGKYGLWKEQFPPMPTKRQWTAALHTGTHLIVAGGWGSANVALTTVEVLNLETRKWFTADKLPEPLFHASMSLCNDRIYILGGYDETKSPSETVYICTLSELLTSMTLTSTPLHDEVVETKSTVCIWKRVDDLPVTESTSVSLYGQLLAVGGRETSTHQSTTAIYKYSLISKSWIIVSHMFTARHLCFAAVLPDNRLLVVGGETGTVHNDSAEMFTSCTEVKFHIEGTYRPDFIVVPGVINCFSCALANISSDNRLFWDVSVDRHFVPATSVPNLETEGHFLVLQNPESYVKPGTAGRRDIICTDLHARELEARLVSPELLPPLFYDVTLKVGDQLTLICTNRCPSVVSTIEIFYPSGRAIQSTAGILIVPNVTVMYSGTYRCVVTSKIYDNTTVMKTADVHVHGLTPSKPLNVTVESVGATALNVKWEPPIDATETTVMLYRIRLLEVSLTTYVIASNGVLNHLLRSGNLVENTTYMVEVGAFNDIGIGDVAMALGTTQSISEPQRILDQPTSHNVTSISAVVMWTFPGGIVDAFLVQYLLLMHGSGSHDLKNITVNGSETSAVIDDLLPLTTYEFRVAVVNGKGTSSFSQSNIFTTMCNKCSVCTCKTVMIYAGIILATCMAVCVVVFMLLCIVLIKRKHKVIIEEPDYELPTFIQKSSVSEINTDVNVSYTPSNVRK